jgi:hypothetical protein
MGFVLCEGKREGKEEGGEEVYRHYAGEVGMFMPGVLPRISGRNAKFMIKTSDWEVLVQPRSLPHLCILPWCCTISLDDMYHW